MPDGQKETRAEQIERGFRKPPKKKSDDDSEHDDDEPFAEIERQEIPLPDIPPGSEYLVAFLHSAGTASSSGMGLTGLSWQEIGAWVKCTDNIGIATPKDLRVVHTLSRVYANEFAAASKKGAMPPFTPVKKLDEEERKQVAKKVDDLFDLFIFEQEDFG